MTSPGNLSGRRLVHVTTSDISLALLLGPQLRVFAAAGMEVIGVSAPGPWADRLTDWGARHEPLRHATRSVDPVEDARALVELTRLLRRLAPDIVHTHNPKPGLYGRVAARLARVPVVVNTVHGLYATAEDSAIKRALVYAAERAASVCSDAELVQNVEDVEVLRRLRVPERKLVLLGNGVDLERFHPGRDPEGRAEARASLGLDAGAFVVGTVARLVWQKGFRELFAAAQTLRDRRPEVVFCVVGPNDPDKADALSSEDVARARRLGNVRFCGLREDVENVYTAFDVFALPSYREGFSRTGMEAAACGVPVIASDIRGCRQVVDDGVTGLLVPPHDAEALASAIELLVDDTPRRQAMGKNATAKAEAEFDDRTVARTTLETYRRLLQGHPGRQSAGRT